MLLYEGLMALSALELSNVVWKQTIEHITSLLNDDEKGRNLTPFN